MLRALIIQSLFGCIIVILMSGCGSTMEFGVRGTSVTHAPQSFLDVSVVGMTMDQRGNFSEAITKTTVDKRAPKNGFKYVLIELEFSNNGISSVELDASKLVAKKKSGEEIDIYIFEDKFEEIGYLPFSRNLLSKGFSRVEEIGARRKYIPTFLALIEENESEMTFQYDQGNPVLIKF